MKLLVVESFGHFLGRKGDRLVVRRGKERLLEVPVAGVDLIRLSCRGTCVSGDAMALALRYGVSVRAIMSYNGITNPRRIRPGRVIYIPPRRGKGG